VEDQAGFEPAVGFKPSD